MADGSAPIELGAKAFLILGVEEANGKLENEKIAWNTLPDPATGLPFEAFVKGRSSRSAASRPRSRAVLTTFAARCCALMRAQSSSGAATRR